MPTFDGQALGDDRAKWTQELCELLQAVDDALKAKNDAALSAAQQSLEAYESYPCPDPVLRGKAKQALENLSLTVIEGLIGQLNAAQPPVTLVNASMLKMEDFSQSGLTMRHRLLHTHYSLTALQKQHLQQSFRHENHPAIGKQISNLLKTTQDLLNQPLVAQHSVKRNRKTPKSST